VADDLNQEDTQSGGMTREEAVAAGYDVGDEQPQSQDGGMTREEAVAAGYDVGEAPSDLESSASGAFARRFVPGATKLAGSLPFMAAGAGLGMTVAGPPGAIVLGVAGAIGGGALMEEVYDKVRAGLGLDKGNGFFSKAQEQADIEQHPVAAQAGDIASMAAAFGTGVGAVKTGQRVLSAGLLGGMNVGEQLVRKDLKDFSPGEAAIAAATGFALPKPRALTEKIMAPFSKYGSEIGQKMRPGRPDMDGSPEKTATEQNDVTTVARGVAADNPPVPTGRGEDIGNVASRPIEDEGNSGKYAKRPPPAAEPTGESSPMTTDPIAPDKVAALGEQAIQKAAKQELSSAAAPAPEDIVEGPWTQAATEASYPHPDMPEVTIDRSRNRVLQVSLSPEDKTVYINKSVPSMIDVAGKPLDPAYPMAAREVMRHNIQAELVENAKKGAAPMERDHMFETAKRAGEIAEQTWLESRGYNVDAYREAMDKITGAPPSKTQRAVEVSKSSPTAPNPSLEPLKAQRADENRRSSLPNLDVNLKTDRRAGERRGANLADVGNYQGPDRRIDELGRRRAAEIAAEPPESPAVREALNQPMPERTPLPTKTPTVVERALNEARTRNMPKVVAELEKATGADQMQKADMVLRNLGSRTGKPITKPQQFPRVRAEETLPVVDDLKNKEGKPITAPTKALADTRTKAIEALEKTFKDEAFQPKEGETPEAMRERLQAALKAATNQNGGKNPLDYKPVNAPNFWRWMHEASIFANRKNLTPAAVQRMQVAEQMARGTPDQFQAWDSARHGKNITDFKREGSDVVEAAEKRAAATEQPGAVEDAAIEKIDEARAAKPPVTSEEAPVTPEEAPVTPEVTAPEPTVKRSWKVTEQEKAEKEAAKTERLKALRLSRVAGATPKESAGAAGEGRRVPLTEEAKKAATDSLAKAEAKKATPEEKLATFWTDEKASLSPKNIMDTLFPGRKGAAGEKAKGVEFERKKRYIARVAKTQQEEYSHSLSDDLHKVNQADVTHSEALLRAMKNAPADLADPKNLEDIYLARENGTIGSLPQKLQDLFNKHLKPILDENDVFYKNIVAMDPEAIGPAVMDHLQRMPKSGDPMMDVFQSAASPDPIEGVRGISKSPHGPAIERAFYALERSDGKRLVISPTKGGYDIWDKYHKTSVKDPNFAFEDGKSYKDAKDSYVMDQALTPEIEANARFRNGDIARYYKNAFMSAASTNYYLGRQARHMQYLETLKGDKNFLEFATVGDHEKAQEKGWKETQLPQFRNWYMDPQLANVMDDFARPGFRDASPNWLRSLSQSITKLMFWVPTAHIANVGNHWFVQRGWDWMNPVAYQRLAATTARAIKSVITQDAYQKALREEGAGTVYGGVLTKDFMGEMGRALKVNIERNKKSWEPIADTLGLNFRDFVETVYRGSSKVMWAANDVFLTQAAMELEAKGMKLSDAIVHAERHIPNYRIPAAILGAGEKGRFLSQILQDPTYMAFGRYHYGVFNSYANMVKDLTRGTGKEKVEAIGNLMAIGLLAMAVKPVLDKAVRVITGNKDAESNARGPLALPHHLMKTMQGKEDPLTGLRTTFTIPPMLSTALETLSNKSFTGKPILEPGTAQRIGRGQPSAVGKAVVQEGEHALRGLVAPVNTAFNAMQKKLSLPEAVRDAALDIRNPSKKSARFEKMAPVTTFRKERARDRNPPGPIEKVYNKAVRGFRAITAD
jgi:hypothetical protein